MNQEQIAKLKEVALKAPKNPGEWPFYLRSFQAAATPAAILELIALAERALLAAAPATIQQDQSDWRIVPVEPTRDMWTAANKADDAAYVDGSQHGADIATLWEAMLDAAPVRPSQQATTIPNENNDLSNKNESEVAASVPPALAGSQVQAAGDMLQPDDLKALQRFFECCEDFDSGGHDVSKERMARLHELGVVQSKGFGRHQITAFGDYVLCLATNTPARFPLKTFAEYNEDARLAHEAKLTAMREQKP